MEQHIRESMNDEILEMASKLYDVPLKDIKYFGGFENFIYVFTRDKVDYILRFVHSDHKIFDYVLAEIEFIDYLSHHGACVSTVVHSINEEIVEKINISQKEYFSVSAFVKGLGHRPKEEVTDPEFWENLGEQIGLLHRLTKDFNPKHKRPEWQNDTLYQIAGKVLKDDTMIYEALQARMHRILSYPQTRDNYGLIHTDLHIGNMVIDDKGKLTFFDFDDSAYKHFISDIAIVIFYQFGFSNPSMHIKNERTIFILRHFFKGYNKQNVLPREELHHLQDFLKLREVTLYTAIMAGGPDLCSQDWAMYYLDTYRDKIIYDEPFIDLHYVMSQI